MPSSIVAGNPAPANRPPVLQHDGCTDRCGTFTPEDEGPATLLIGARASAEQIARAAARHDIDPVALLQFARGGRHG